MTEYNRTDLAFKPDAMSYAWGESGDISSGVIDLPLDAGLFDPVP